MRGQIENLFDKNGIDEITCNVWISTDIAELISVNHSSDDFLDAFIEKLDKLLPHAFVALQQNKFMHKLKCTLKTDEYIEQCDIAENYFYLAR